jgi:hypothetical protein
MGNFVDIPVGPVDREGFILLIEGFYIINIFPELMGRIAAGRRPAHPENGRTGWDIIDDQFDLRFVVREIGETDDIADSLSEDEDGNAP